MSHGRQDAASLGRAYVHTPERLSSKSRVTAPVAASAVCPGSCAETVTGAPSPRSRRRMRQRLMADHDGAPVAVKSARLTPIVTHSPSLDQLAVPTCTGSARL